MSRRDDEVKFEDAAAIAAMQTLLETMQFHPDSTDPDRIAEAAWDVAYSMGYQRRWRMANALCVEDECEERKKCTGCIGRMTSDE